MVIIEENIDWENNRLIPGTSPIEGREHVYVEVFNKQKFCRFFSKFASACKGIPKDGGATGDRAIIQMPSGKLMHAMSYKRDIEGWRLCITKFCEENNIIRGKIEGDHIVLTNGESALLSDCKVDMW